MTEKKLEDMTQIEKIEYWKKVREEEELQRENKIRQLSEEQRDVIGYIKNLTHSCLRRVTLIWVVFAQSLLLSYRIWRKRLLHSGFNLIWRELPDVCRSTCMPCTQCVSRGP